MKKNRRRNIKDYSKFEDDFSMEYNGLFLKKGKLRIDIKRVIKLGNLFEGTLKDINKIPRNTEYFFPKNKKRDDYKCNIFHDHLNYMENLWNKEFVHVINAIKTPKQAGNDAFTQNVSYGILEPEELEIVRVMETIYREREYNIVIETIYAQFIHYIGSVVEAVQINVMNKEGYDTRYFGRRQMNKILKDKQNKNKIIHNVDKYNRFYDLWNFMKHNSISSYDKLKSSFPEILIKNDFKGGDYSLNYLRLDDQIIPNILTDLDNFFNSFCEIVFDENPKEAQWNYDEYFIWNYNKWKGEMDNLLGIPPYL